MLILQESNQCRNKSNFNTRVKREFCCTFRSDGEERL